MGKERRRLSPDTVQSPTNVVHNRGMDDATPKTITHWCLTLSKRFDFLIASAKTSSPRDASWYGALIARPNSPLPS